MHYKYTPSNKQGKLIIEMTFQNRIFALLSIKKTAIHLPQFICLCLVFIFSVSLSAQKTVVKGRIIATDSNNPVEFVTVYVPKSTVGTISDSLGMYEISTTVPFDTIVFSVVGYREQRFAIKKRTINVIDVKLVPNVINLNEVKVKPNDGPMRALFQKMIDRKEQNNPEKYRRSSFEKYTRWEYHLNNVGDGITNSRDFKKNPNLIKTGKDSSKYLPVYFSEQLVYNEIQRDPLKMKSTILGDKTSGLGLLQDYEISGYTSGLDIEVNFYDNFINLFTQNFVSPLSDNGWFYYRYYLVDSVKTEHGKNYKILFFPRRSGDKAFKGYMTTEDRNYSLVQIDATLSTTSNINFLQKMRLAAEFQMVNDTMPFYKRNLIEATIDYMPIKATENSKRLEVSFSQASSIDKVVLNQKTDVELSNKNLTYESVKESGAYKRDSLFWDHSRHFELTDRDRGIYNTIDSVNQLPSVKLIDKFGKMYMTGFFDVGKIELGPYSYFYNSNAVEGKHLFFGARTSSEISEKFMIWAGVGYGTRINQVMGRLGGGYKFDTPLRKVVRAQWSDDIVRIGESEQILYLYENMITPSETNLISQIFKRQELYELYRQQKVALSYEHEWRTGFSSKFQGKFLNQFSPEFYPFVYKGQAVDAFASYEASVDFRWSWKEKFIDNEFLRFYYNTDYPIIHLTLAGGAVDLPDKVEYFSRVHATIKHDVYLGQAMFMYALEGGAVFGQVPYTLLEIARGNQTYGFYAYDFNLVNYMEFIHDKYLHGYFEYHLNGFFFNRAPLLKKLGLREVLSAKAMIGGLDKRQFDMFNFPVDLKYNNQPYLEVGAGVENIFKFFRLDAVWRVSPNSTVNAPMFGIRGQFAIKL